MREQSWGLVVAVVAALALLIFVGYRLLQRDEGAAPVVDAEPPAAVIEERPLVPEEPVYPIDGPEEEAAADSAPEGEPEPLPELADSDEAFGEAAQTLLAAAGQPVPELRDGIIRRLVATTDSLARNTLAERIRPLDSVAGPFLVSGKVDGDLYILSPANYERYDNLVDALAGMDMSEAAAVYRRYYPLFQQAYTELGYPDSYFNDRLVAVIDQLLATPDVADPIRLVRPHVLYQFENPVLEDLSSGQKLLLRMGPDNRETVKTVLRQFRARITGAGGASEAEAPSDDTSAQ